MKINIGPYKDFIGPYQIAEFLCFWSKKDGEYPDWVHDFGVWLAEDKNGDLSKFNQFFQWIDSKRKRKIKIRIDPYDSWNVDTTLSHLIVPLVKQLKETGNSIGAIHPDDCPPELRGDFNEDDFNTHYSKERWNWFLDEIIWTFEQNLNDGDAQFFDHGEKVKGESFEASISKIKVDKEGLQKYEDRRKNGYRLFGKYLPTLWD